MIARSALSALLALGLAPTQEAAAPRLPAPAQELFHQAVEWSPDGRWIGFSEFAGGESSPEKWSIQIMAADGSARRTLTQGVFFSWSPDGQRLVFDARREGNQDLFVVGLDGQGLERLTHHEGEDSQPAWSPDGSTIAFSSEREGQREIHLLALQPGAVTRLTSGEGEALDPAWSPDGKAVVFFRSMGDGQDQVFVVAREGGDARRVTSGEGHNIFPSFLPDGRVGYTRVLPDGTKELAWSRADGSGVERIGGLPVSYARWSPDGAHVAFIAGRWPRSAVYVMKADGTGIRKLAN